MKLLDRLEEIIVIGMMIAMTVLTFSQVVMRYGFNQGWQWALELTTVFFAIMIFVGISYGVRVGAHIGVDALVTQLNPGPRRALSILVVGFSLVYAGLVIYGSMIYVSKMKTVGVEMEDMAIPIWVVRSILPIGFTLLTVRLIQVMWALIAGKTNNLHLADEAADALKLRSDEAAR
ncbi:MAG: TRAP transporter small permease [Burkholderiaceae bacterium]